MGHEALPGPTPEEARFDGVSDVDLVRGFLKSDMNDPAAGRELSRRLHKHADYPGDPAAEQLTWPDGRPVLDEAGQCLTRDEYANWAARHHPHGMRQIVSFLFTERGTQEYDTGRATFAGYAGGDQPQTGRS